MPKFRVTEIIVYEVEAEDEDHAHDIIVNADDPDEYFVEVKDRQVEER